MYQYKLQCPKGHTTDEIESYLPVSITKWCKECNKAQEHKPIDDKEIGICKDCKNLEELEWFTSDEDSPHHGDETECETCGAIYYDAGDGYYTLCNEEAQMNFPGLTKL